MALFLRRLKSMGSVHIFGVRPEQDSWVQVYRMLRQTALISKTTVEKQVFTNLTVPPGYYPQRSGRGFMIELWDCAHCADMIKAKEASIGWQFELVVRLRLDLFWEYLPPMPRTFEAGQVHLPSMSKCRGYNDKFAIGDRIGMERYLMRVHKLPYTIGGKFASEEYLKRSLAGLRVKAHYDWMFCKMGRATNLSTWRQTSSNMWLECSARIVQGLRCERMVCGWCGQGCRCWNSTCTSVPYDSQRNVLGRVRLCHEWMSSSLNGNKSRGGVPLVPGIAVPPGRQLFLSR